MSFPSHNNIFQQGNFAGFSVRGRSRVARNFRHAWEGHSLYPGLGEYFAILDDPNLIDLTNGTRLPNSQIRPFDLTPPATSNPLDTSDYSFADILGQETRGIDGASLAIEDIELAAGQGLIMRWNFLVYDHRGHSNDFVIAEITDEPTNILIDQKILMQSQELKRSDGSYRWSSGWMPYFWETLISRRITLRLIVSNGYTFNPSVGSDPLQRVKARAFPSGLLVDGVWLV